MGIEDDGVEDIEWSVERGPEDRVKSVGQTLGAEIETITKKQE